MLNVFAKELKHSKYRLLGLVGQGQFGRVYCASHRKTGRLVALKQLDKDRFPTHRFLRELRFLLSLQHPNIVTCHALEHMTTGRYLVMDYCEGGTLRSLVDDGVQLHPVQAFKLVLDILAGLEHAHNRDIIHCDIKPENILLSLDADGWMARITDFGIARLVQDIVSESAGNTGSPAYMAPERFYGQYSHSSDLYSVGVLLYELVVGHRPFSGTPTELMSAHLNQPVKLPEQLSASLKLVILTALQKLPGRRYRSALDMAQALEAAIQDPMLQAQLAQHPNGLIRPATTLTPVPGLWVKQDSTVDRVQQLVGFAGQPQVLHSAEGLSSDRLHWISGSRVVCRVFPEGIFSPVSDLEFASPPMVVRLPDAVHQIVVQPQGCIAITDRSIYLLPPTLFQSGIAQHGQKLLQQGLAATPNFSHTVPLLIAEFTQSVLATVDPKGRWMATVTPDAEQSWLSFWNLQQIQPFKPMRRLFLPGVMPPFRLLALDSRHLLTLAHRVDRTALACINGACLTVLTRRGNCVGTFELPVPLRQVMLGATPYRLVATEPAHANSLLLIDLKPLKIQRVGLEISPMLLAAMSWGYVVVDSNGQIVLINHYGEQVGCIAGPANPTAIAPLDPYGVAISTWANGQGALSVLDFRALEIDLMF